MKNSTKKKTIYLALGFLLLLSIVQVRNVKLIVDSRALFGFQLDLTDAELSFRGAGTQDSSTEVADVQNAHDQDVSLP